MVNVRAQFCIDRWEATTVDAASQRALSPYYPPHVRLARLMFDHWSAEFANERSAYNGYFSEASAPAPPSLLDDDPSDHLALSVPSPVRSIAGFDASVPAEDDDEELDAGTIAIGHDAIAPPRTPMALPALPDWQQSGGFVPMAVSKANVVPQGYVPGFVAVQACRASGKRLCREDEWVTACKGQQHVQYPYGQEYRQGVCNVFREAHPGAILHGDCSRGLSDPRLNLVKSEGADLLRETGGTPHCASHWGSDVIYDMVGNVDEWVDDPDGVFVGGFYARNTRKGCESRVSAHPPAYFDYSLGFRCCADLGGR